MVSRRVDVHPVDEEDPLSSALLYLIAHSMDGGVRNAGDLVTIMVPDGMEYSHSKGGQTIEMGEWEITLKKVS